MAPLSRKWLPVVGAVALALTFAQSPGQVSPDTKLDLTANPLRFLARATNLWNSDLPFGQAQNQAYGYLFPHGTFFVIGHLLGVPGWVTQRLWWAVLLTVSGGVVSPQARLVSAVEPAPASTSVSVLASDRGAGALGFVGTAGKESVGQPAGLTVLADEFGDGAPVPMLPGSWGPDLVGVAGDGGLVSV